MEKITEQQFSIMLRVLEGACTFADTSHSNETFGYNRKVLEHTLSDVKRQLEPITISDPDGIINQPSMELYAEKGHKVTVTKQSIQNGFDYDKKKAEKFLKVGEIYTIEDMEVYNWSSTVILQEIPNERFNSVNFIDVN